MADVNGFAGKIEMVRLTFTTSTTATSGSLALSAREMTSSDLSTNLLTTLVVGESWTFLNRRAGRASALDYLDRVQTAERLEILSLTADHEADAFAVLRQRDEREYSYVDATSFAVMRALRIRRALAFDGDFSAAGFDELRPTA